MARHIPDHPVCASFHSRSHPSCTRRGLKCGKMASIKASGKGGNMKRIAIGIAAPTLMCAFAAVTLWGQATAQISGTVKDQSGAVLPGVEITATQTQTGVARSTITNETGSYVLANLPIGLTGWKRL